ncbi:Uncharacterised protein [uncultured archaeon]|nr:Uncharacterised protein [uncultured archaeon]
MNKTTKEKFNVAVKTAWIIVGFLILLLIGVFYLEMNSPTGIGIVKWVVHFAIGVYSFILYIVITGIVLFIKWLKRTKK